MKVDSFQVTGTVSAMDDSSITVMKGKERFQIAKDAATKVTGEVKVGSKVTVHYKMYAVDVEGRPKPSPPRRSRPAFQAFASSAFSFSAR